MKKTTLRQVALKLAFVAFVLLAPLGLRAQQSLPYSYGFEDNDLSIDGWSTQNPSGLNASKFGIHTSAAQTGSYGFRFSSYDDNGTSTQYLISPELDAPSGVVVQFSYKKYSTYGTETFKVGYSTTDSDISSFTFGSEISASTSWTLSDEFNFPAGTKYIAIYYYPNFQYWLYIDDFTFNAPASCPKPTGLTCTATTGTPATATLSWTNGGTETNWVLEYSTAADFTGATTINISDGDLNDGTYTLTTGLTAETRYYAHLKADCGGGDESIWSNTIDFKPSNVQNIPIGSGNSTTNYFPSHTNWKYSYTQQIYTASEIGQAGTIKSISFKGNKAGTRSWVIYLVNTTKESFSSTNDFISIADATQVFNDNVTFVANDWTTIELDGDGFDYQGENLAIIVDDNSGNYTMGSTNWAAFSTASTNQALYFYQDSGTPDNIDPTSPNASYKNISTDKSQIKLGILPSNTPKPRNLHFDNVTSIAATMIWEEPNITPDSYEYQYKLATATDWPTDWTTNSTNLSVILSLSASTTYDFRVRATYSEGESDPVEIQFTTLDNCAYPTNLTASTTPGQGTKATLTWVKGYDEEAWVLEYATNNAFTEGLVEVTTGFTTEGTTVTYNATGLTPETHYYARVKANCDGPTSSPSNVAEFTPTNYVDFTFGQTASYTSTYVPFYGYYASSSQLLSQFIIPSTELEDVAGGTIRRMTFYSSTASASWGDAEFSVYVKEVEATSFSASSAEGLEDWESMTNVYSGSLSISGNQMVIEFENNFTYNGGNLMIGFNKTTTGTGASASWYYVSGSSNSTLYAYNPYNSAYSRGSSLPKVTFNYQPTPYVKIAAINEGTITTTSAQLTWAAPETEATITGYAYQYKLSSAAEWPTTWSNLAANATSVTLQPLIASSSYDFRIKVLYGEHESVITSTSFYTGCDVVTAFPWRENFDTRSFGNFSDPCWVNEHLTVVGNYASTVFTVEASNNENRIKLLKLPDESIGNTIKLRLPQMTLPNDNYQFVLDVYRSDNTYNSNYPDEGIRVYVSTDGEIEGATELTFIPRQYNVSSTLIHEETAEGWYTYEIPIGISGTCYIILRGESQYCTSTYIDNLTVEEIPSCARPTDLAKSDVTNHSATLTWTAGDENQHNWQVAYSKTSFDPNTASFDINTVETIDFTTSTTCTFRMDRLFDAASTYYLYIRANCGTATEPDYGPWSRNGISLTTSAAAPAPSAFTASNIASTKVDLVWNAGGGDYELSWDLYYLPSDDAPTAPTDETPATKTVTTLPTTEVPYELDNLAEESRYYIWVRANHGTDGNSGWVALTGDFFTTLAACSAQDPIVSNITHQNATVTWDGESQDGYTVKYRTAAGIDNSATPALSENFSGTSIPTDWIKYRGKLSGNTATLTSDSYGWSFGPNHEVFDNHAYVNIYGNYQRWLVTPETTLPANAGLSFDLALTCYDSYSFAPQTNGTDDKFIVLISTDNMTTWTKLREWNNDGTGNAVYNDIANTTTGENVTIDLSGYSGQTVYIAFYGESTTSDADNNLHIDNVVVAPTVPAGNWQHQAATTTTAELSGLKTSTIYDVKIVANCGDNVESDVVSFTTPAITKTVAANSWYAISTPVNTGSDIMNLTNAANDLFGYNEEEGKWVASNSLNVGQGYIYRRAVGATLNFKGVVNEGPISADVTASCEDANLAGFNLVGNPYMHEISYNYAYYSLNTNGTWQAHTNGIIGVAEGFLVRVSTDGSIDFPDQLPANDNTANSALAFTVSNEEYSDVAYAMLDNGEGLRKIGHLNSEAPMLSIPVEGRRYAIANLGSDCESFDMVLRAAAGTYTLSFNGNTGYCHLIDRETGKDIDMLRQSSYTFTATGSNATRFMVKLSPNAAETDNSSFVYWNGSAWVVEGNGTLQVFDVLGRKVFSKEVNTEVTIPTSQFPGAGVYIIRLGEKSQKIVVK